MLQKVGWLIGLFTEIVVLLSYMEEKPNSHLAYMQMLQEVGWLTGWFTEVVVLLSSMEEKPALNAAHTHSILAGCSCFRHFLKEYVNSIHVVSHL